MSGSAGEDRRGSSGPSAATSAVGTAICTQSRDNLATGRRGRRSGAAVASGAATMTGRKESGASSLSATADTADAHRTKSPSHETFGPHIHDTAIEHSCQAERSLDEAVHGTHVLPAYCEAVVVGAGLTGLVVAGRLADAATDMSAFIVLEKQHSAGGVWRYHCNSTSRVQSSEPSYRLPISRRQVPTNHTPRFELLAEMLELIRQKDLAHRIHTQTEARGCAAQVDRWAISAYQTCDGLREVVRCDRVVLCTARMLGRPRMLRLRNESVFGGMVIQGVNGVDGLRCAHQPVLIYGFGAFAVENLRTCLERGAVHVDILCRRRGTVCPQIVDWVNYVRAVDDNFERDPRDSAAIFAAWSLAYEASSTAKPGCWQRGLMKEDGHNITISDIFFIAHYLGLAATLQAEILHLVASGVVTSSGGHLSAAILIKCIGFDISESNERMLARAHVPQSSAIRVFAEGHFDARYPTSPFGGSYVNGLLFHVEMMLHSWRNPAHLYLASGRLNAFHASSIDIALRELAASDSGVRALFQQYLHSVAEGSCRTMTPAAYVAYNRQIWAAAYRALLATVQSLQQPRIAAVSQQQEWVYPFSNFFDQVTLSPAVAAFQAEQDSLQRGRGGGIPSLLKGSMASAGHMPSHNATGPVLWHFNDTSATLPSDQGPCIHHLVVSQAVYSSAAAALEWEDSVQLSYGELVWCAQRVSIWLQCQSVVPDHAVALQFARSLEQVVGMVGALMSGSAYLPLSLKWPEQRRQFMVADAECEQLIAQSLDGWTWFDGIVLSLDSLNSLRESTEGTKAPLVEQCMSPHNLAYIMYTSGARTLPQAVLAHRNAHSWPATMRYCLSLPNLEHLSLAHNSQVRRVAPKVSWCRTSGS